MIEWSYARGVSTVLGVYHHKRCSSYMQGHVVACMGMQLRARAVTCKGLEVPLGGSRGPGSASEGLVAAKFVKCPKSYYTEQFEKYG